MATSEEMLDNTEPQDFRFGLKRRVYNWNMRRAREGLHLTQADLAKLAGISLSLINHYESLRYSPSPNRAEIIAGILNVDVSALFPDWLKYMVVTRPLKPLPDQSFSLEEITPGRLPEMPLLITDGGIGDVEEKVSMELLNAKIMMVLGQLTPRERKVIELLFGLNGNHEHTLKEAGLVFDVTKERVRQIQTEALRKLRHPSKSRHFTNILE